MNRSLVWLVAVLALAGAFAIFEPFFSSRGSGAAGPASFAGQPAPVFQLRDDLGAPASLAAYRGVVVVMNLWASWCPPCRAEMPDLQRLADRYPQSRVVIVGVNEGESAERAAAFARSLRIRFPIWVDATQQYGRAYGALGLPSTVIVNRQGVVVRGFDGAMTFDQMQAAVAPVARAR